MRVYKRNGTQQDFIEDKIKQAIAKANNAVPEADKMTDEQSEKVFQTVLTMLKGFDIIKVEDIQDIVEKALMKHNRYGVAKAYILYRDQKKQNKKFNSIEEQALSLLAGTNEELRGDNANKKTDMASSIRDYLAGLVCKSLFYKTAPKTVVKYHTKGMIHYHDSDYAFMPIWNCDLINVKNMVENGTQMGDTHIASPKMFTTLCTLLSQFNLIVSGSQYGGQTISWAHAAPFVQKTRETYSALYDKVQKSLKWYFWFVKLIMKIPALKKAVVEFMTKHDVHVGIKTYQYQVVCHHSSNGQSPFVSNNLNLREAQTPQEQKDLAFIIEEIFKRRLKGVKDGHMMDSGPLFPKLLYWECEGLNLDPGDPYYYLTKLAAKCNAYRCQPDINSEKKSREIKKGQIIPSMGCRSWLSPVWELKTYPIDTKFWYQFVDDDTTFYDNAPGPNFNYTKKENSETRNGVKYINGFGYYDALPLDLIGKVVINFGGNSGWVHSFDKEKGEIIISEPVVYGRFNSGVVTCNLPHAAGSAVLEAEARYNKIKEQQPEFVRTCAFLMEVFYEKLDEYLQVCREGLIFRTNQVKKIKARNVPLLLQYGGIARLQPDETVEDWIKMHPKLMSTSFGFIGLYETCQFLIGESNTTEKGQALCIDILEHINQKIDEWAKEDGLNYSLYGTPEENLTTKAAAALRRDFGLIEHITDKDYVVNSYHVDPREEISWPEKLRIEGKYLSYVSGGAVSYIETGDLRKNTDSILTVMRTMYDTIAYAEFNRIMGHCCTCGFDGVIALKKSHNGIFSFECPSCKETRDDYLSVQGRICGYLGGLTAGNTSYGRLDDIFHRWIHLP